MKQSIQAVLLAAIFFGATVGPVAAQGTAFLYQGRLSDTGTLANTNYNFCFAIYNAVTNGSLVGSAITNYAVPASNGLFTTALDFGPSVFTGPAVWLDIGVCVSTVTNFIMLSPRQPVLAVPYAIFAGSASNLVGTLSATQLVGTLQPSQFSGTYTGRVSFVNATNIFSGAFSGNGVLLTNLNGSLVATGTVADARLSTNVALLNTNQTFSGTNIFTGTNFFYGSNTFTNRGNSFVGSFFGNGLVGWVPVSGTYTQAVADTGYLLSNPGLTTVQLPAAPTLGDIVRVAGAGAGGWLVQGNSGQSILGNFASYRNGFVLSSGNSDDWRCLASSADGSRMYAGGNFSGGVYYSTDLGHTWNPTTKAINGSGWVSIACSANGNVIFVAPNGNSASPIESSPDGGLTWVSVSTSAYWQAIACSADGTKYLAGATSGALVFNSNNIASSPPASGNWTAVASSANGSNLAATIGSTVWCSTNAGTSGTWYHSSASLPGSCSALAAAANGLNLVAAYNGGIATSTNFGGSWTTTSAGTTNWNCLAGSSDCSRLVAGVSNGLFYASANFGATWTALSSTNQFWSDAAMSADGTKFAATISTVQSITGNIYYSGNGSTPGFISTTNAIGGSQGSSVELQYIGGNQFMPVSSSGVLWAN